MWRAETRYARVMSTTGPRAGGEDDPLVEALGRVPAFAGRRLTLTPLSGGFTNRNFVVAADGSVDRYVVRVPGDGTELLGISRDVEHAAAGAAARVGVGAGVVAFIQPEGYLVTRFIDGSSVSAEAIHQPAMLRRIAASLRLIHDGPRISGSFAPFRIVEAYRDLAAAHGVAIPAVYDDARAIGRRIEAACVGSPVPSMPCHNDLLSAHLIDDGTRIRIVDWEYAGMGDPFFDLGNLSVNNDLTTDEDATLLAAYDGVEEVAGAADAREIDRSRLARLTLMRVMSDFREAMWAVVQQGISTLDADFSAYASKHFDRLLANASDSRFERALREVAGG
jgi:thiamine kinase-like enzyme